MNIKEIKEMLQLMAEHGLTEVEIEKDGLKLKLRKGNGRGMAEEICGTQTAVIPLPVGNDFKPAAALEAAQAVMEASNVTLIKSPMVGTFYSSPAPDQPVYVAVNKKIKEGDVLCIVEAMKLMNEIKSEMAGTIVEILVKNGQPVEFDQPLFKVQKA